MCVAHVRMGWRGVSAHPAKRKRPEIEWATEVMPQRILSCVYWLSSALLLMSKRRQDASSEPERARAHADGR